VYNQFGGNWREVGGQKDTAAWRRPRLKGRADETEEKRADKKVIMVPRRYAIGGPAEGKRLVKKGMHHEKRIKKQKKSLDKNVWGARL